LRRRRARFPGNGDGTVLALPRGQATGGVVWRADAIAEAVALDAIAKVEGARFRGWGTALDFALFGAFDGQIELIGHVILLDVSGWGGLRAQPATRAPGPFPLLNVLLCHSDQPIDRHIIISVGSG